MLTIVEMVGPQWLEDHRFHSLIEYPMPYCNASQRIAIRAPALSSFKKVTVVYHSGSTFSLPK
jgi:hypothetical protein